LASNKEVCGQNPEQGHKAEMHRQIGELYLG